VLRDGFVDVTDGIVGDLEGLAVGIVEFLSWRGIF
jgi:hypothetical protein